MCPEQTVTHLSERSTVAALPIIGLSGRFRATPRGPGTSDTVSMNA